MSVYAEQLNSYRVEASGWDASEDFFVENASLTWGSDEMEEIHLRCSLKEGSIVFVRLMRPLTSDDINTIPIPYQVMRVFPRDVNGQARIQLRQLRPQCNSNRAETSERDFTVKIA